MTAVNQDGERRGCGGQRGRPLDGDHAHAVNLSRSYKFGVYSKPVNQRSSIEGVCGEWVIQ